ncbi:MAG: molybdopterin converting factor subunit 1 [Proteobacteria bacterium]|nr:molybdopterin converting factor subunit 1 [Pseudomonadota bacterium]
MLSIHYFASIREALDKDHEQLELPESVASVADLMRHLSTINPLFKPILDADRKVLVAVNQTVVDKDYRLSEDDEVAFFPPMTGG